mmetsp:Transcript_19175/g.37193  ORF Transcript_19175/g.37193 Transcript_19175/m.37193 type:complete len:282 (-) Transcript_19175:408-1253(-)
MDAPSPPPMDLFLDDAYWSDEATPSVQESEEPERKANRRASEEAKQDLSFLSPTHRDSDVLRSPSYREFASVDCCWDADYWFDDELLPKTLGEPETKTVAKQSAYLTDDNHFASSAVRLDSVHKFWPISYRVTPRQRFADYSWKPTVVLQAPDRNTPIRKSNIAKKPTYLCFELKTDSGIVEKRCIPLKITSRMRNVKTRGPTVSRVEYTYRDGKTITLGGPGIRIQMRPPFGGVVPQAFLVADKSDAFGVRMHVAPSKAWYGCSSNEVAERLKVLSNYGT